MYRNKIAEEIYRSGWLHKHCHTLSNDKDLMDDLMQEVVLSILEYKGVGLKKAYDEGNHLPFVKMIIRNQYNSRTSPFWYKYRKNVGEELFDETFINKENNEDKD